MREIFEEASRQSWSPAVSRKSIVPDERLHGLVLDIAGNRLVETEGDLPVFRPAHTQRSTKRRSTLLRGSAHAIPMRGARVPQQVSQRSEGEHT